MIKGKLNGAHARRSAWQGLASRVIFSTIEEPLLLARGLLTVDIGADGDHGALEWQGGAELYESSAHHNTLAAVGLARAMAPYPGPAWSLPIAPV